MTPEVLEKIRQNRLKALEKRAAAQAAAQQKSSQHITQGKSLVQFVLVIEALRVQYGMNFARVCLKENGSLKEKMCTLSFFIFIKNQMILRGLVFSILWQIQP